MGSAKGDLMVVILLLIALGIGWYATGGPSRPISHSGGLFSAPWPIGNGGNAYVVPQVPLPTDEDFARAQAEADNYTPSEGSTNNSSASIFDRFLGYRPGFSTSPDPATSPYASQIRLSSNGATASDPRQEYITISTQGSISSGITITGWSLESASSHLKVTIGSAASVPALGNLNTEAPVTITSGSVVYVTTGPSPSGSSFRTNKCTGYFEQFQDFTPRLATECPRPQDEMLLYPAQTANNPACESYVKGLQQCTLTVNAIPGNLGTSCQDFILNNLSYNGCIMAHKNDPDFSKNEWRIFINRQQELWKNTHDRILLLDENGKLVASVSY